VFNHLSVSMTHAECRRQALEFVVNSQRGAEEPQTGLPRPDNFSLRFAGGMPYIAVMVVDTLRDGDTGW
jgi:hypothetical protein